MNPEQSSPPSLPLEVGQAVLVARAGAESIEAASATIATVLTNEIVLETEDSLVFLRPGILMIVRPTGCDGVAWGTLERAVSTTRGATLTLNNVRWEDSALARSVRLECEAGASAAYLAGDSHHRMKRLIGHTVDISLTGARIFMRSPLPVGSTIYLSFTTKEGKAIETLARVVRIVRGAEIGRAGGLEVGVTFLRFISGYDELVEAAWADDVAA